MYDVRDVLNNHKGAKMSQQESVIISLMTSSETDTEITHTLDLELKPGILAKEFTQELVDKIHEMIKNDSRIEDITIAD